MFDRRHARFFELEGAPLPLRRRPEGCLQHAELPAVRVKMSELTGITLSVDVASSLDPAPGARVSAVGLLVAASRGDDRFALDDRTRVLGVSGTYRAIYDVLGAWPIELVLVELKALGAGVIREVEMAIRRGWYMDADTDEKVELLGPDGNRVRCRVEAALPGKEDKVQRAHGMRPTWEQHRCTSATARTGSIRSRTRAGGRSTWRRSRVARRIDRACRDRGRCEAVGTSAKEAAVARRS